MKIKKLNSLNWLIFVFMTVVEASHFVSSTTYNYHHRNQHSGHNAKSELQYHRGTNSQQLRKARSSPNQQHNLTSSSSLSASASSLHKVTFLPEDSFEPTTGSKRYTNNFNSKQHHHHHYGSNKHNSNIKRDLTEPIGFLNAVANDHATSSTNQEPDTVRYPPNKSYKTSSNSETPQSFSRRQRDFSESPISNPQVSASETSDSMNADDHESDSGSPFSSSGGSSNGASSSSGDDSPVDSNEDFPSSPHSNGGSGSSAPASGGSSSAGGMDDEPAAPYNDGFGGPSSVDDDHHTRSNSLDEDEQSHHSHHNAPPSTANSRPSIPSYGSSPYLSPSLSAFGPPPPMSSPYRNIYSGGPPPPPIGSFPGYRPITSPLTYPALLSSASNSPMAGSYKTMSSDTYGSAPMTTKYRGYSTNSGSSFSPSSESGQSMFSNPFSFADSFPSSSDSFGASPTSNFGFKSSPSYSLASSDLMGLNNNWYLNQQQYLPLMMKQAGYPMTGGGYAMQYQTTTQAPEQESTKEKDKETGSKTKNRLRFNLNLIRLNNLKLPSLFNWHKNSTTTTPSSSSV